MKANNHNCTQVAFRLLNVVVALALLFFIAQGNSMVITDLFADKMVELVDSDTPAPNEERNDSNNNNNVSEEEDHLHYFSFGFSALEDKKADFSFSHSGYCPTHPGSIHTPPPEYS